LIGDHKQLPPFGLGRGIGVFDQLLEPTAPLRNRSNHRKNGVDIYEGDICRLERRMRHRSSE
jgi:hypothetical protein